MARPFLVAGGGLADGDIYHGSGVQRELRNQILRSGGGLAGLAGLEWMYEGIDPQNLFS